MIRFNFIESARPELVRRLAEFTIPARLRASIFALGAATAIAGAAWAIESYRLADAELVRTHYRVQYEDSRLAVSRVKIVFADIVRLRQVSNRISRIQTSGARLAATLAGIGDRLPPRAWLTTVSVDRTGADLTGKTDGFMTLSRAISSAAPGYSAELLRASLEDRAGKKWPVGYELRLRRSP